MSDKMIEVGGQQFSESTIKKALKRHYDFEEKYQFQMGDVVENSVGSRRLICKGPSGELISVDEKSEWCVTGQREFESCHYKKVGRLSSFFTKKED